MNVLIWLVEHIYLAPAAIIIIGVMILRSRIASRQLGNLSEIIRQHNFVKQGTLFWPHRYVGNHGKRIATMIYEQNIAMPIKQSLTLSLHVNTSLALVISAFPSTTTVLNAMPTLKANGNYGNLRINSSTPAITDKFLDDPTVKAVVLRLAAFGDDYGRFIQVIPGAVSLTVKTNKHFDTDTINNWFADVSLLADMAERIRSEPINPAMGLQP